MKPKFPRRPNFEPRQPGGDESIKLTEEDERALDLAWAKVRERRQARAAGEQEQAPSLHRNAAGE